MSLLFMDGFDHYDEIRTKWSVANTFDNPNFFAGRFGGQRLSKQSQNAAGTITKRFGKQNTLIVGVAIFTGDAGVVFENSQVGDHIEADPIIVDNFPSGDIIRFLDSSDNVLVTISMSPYSASSGRIVVSYSGLALPIPLIDTVPQMGVGSWSYIQIKYNPNTNNGLLEIVDGNGVVIYRYIGKTTTRDDNDVAGIKVLDSTTNSINWGIDDLYVCNAEGISNFSYLGDVRVTPMGLQSVISTNSDSTDHLTALGETLMDDGSFVSMGVIGFFDEYNVANFSCHGFTPVGDVVQGVQVNIATAKNNTGLIQYQLSNNSIYTGTDVAPSTFADASVKKGFAVQSTIYEKDPADGNDWTTTKVDAMKVGFKLTTREGGA